MTAAPPAAFRLNVSHTSPDTTVQQVLDRIDSEVLVVDALGSDGVEGVIGALSMRRYRPASFSLELIAHSRRGVLRIGDWTVDGNGKSMLLHRICGSKLAELNLREIRLLGCNTAISPGGQEAIHRLHEIFNVPVRGTVMPISAADFDAYGFRADAVLRDQSNLPGPAKPTFLEAGAWLARFQQVAGQTGETIMKRLRRESMSDVVHDWSRTRPQHRWPIRQLTRADLDAVLAHAEPELAHAPGLLALPELEIVIPIEDDFGAPRFHRLTVLLEGHWVRVYARDLPDGMVLRAHGDELVQEALQRGTELLRP